MAGRQEDDACEGLFRLTTDEHWCLQWSLKTAQNKLPRLVAVLGSWCVVLVGFPSNVCLVKLRKSTTQPLSTAPITGHFSSSRSILASASQFNRHCHLLATYKSSLLSTRWLPAALTRSQLFDIPDTAQLVVFHLSESEDPQVRAPLPTWITTREYRKCIN